MRKTTLNSGCIETIVLCLMTGDTPEVRILTHPPFFNNNIEIRYMAKLKKEEINEYYNMCYK